jgi:SAM-dependent methyltransferase
MQKYEANRSQSELRGYLRSVTASPPSLLERITRKHFWELKFVLWRLMGKLDSTHRSLSVGPRWVTEIVYFREVLGLRQHIGLDLFSDGSDLVVAGDMHAMPFPDRHFGLIFLKNTVDKSYDVRKLTEELLRVVESRGLIVIDQICGYGRCSPLSRTDIQHATNLLRVFQARASVLPLVCYDIDISGVGDARERNETRRIARLAMQLTEPS